MVLPSQLKSLLVGQLEFFPLQRRQANVHAIKMGYNDVDVLVVFVVVGVVCFD